MAGAEITINGILYDKASKGARPVAVIGTAELTGLGVGGGPIIPPEQPGGGEGIWGPSGPWPVPPIANVPGLPPMGPIFPPNVPPGIQPDPPPAPGSPTTTVPGTWPVSPIQPPAYMIVNYPGVGPVYVAPPTSTATRPPDQPTTAKK